jgi:hypothetical protein
VTGLHHAAIVGAAVAFVGAVACGRLFRVRIAAAEDEIAEAAPAPTSR